MKRHSGTKTSKIQTFGVFNYLNSQPFSLTLTRILASHFNEVFNKTVDISNNSGCFSLRHFRKLEMMEVNKKHMLLSQPARK